MCVHVLLYKRTPIKRQGNPPPCVYNQVYLIDYGLSGYFVDEKNEHLPPVKTKDPLRGTLRYASINKHEGNEQSRRDDMEEVMYVLVSTPPHAPLPCTLPPTVSTLLAGKGAKNDLCTHTLYAGIHDVGSAAMDEGGGSHLRWSRKTKVGPG